MALLDNGCQVNTVIPELMEAHTHKAGPMSNLVEGRIYMVGLGGIHTPPMDYIIIRVYVDGVGGYKKDQIALIIPHSSKFASRVPVTLGTPMIGRVINLIKESKLDVLPWVNALVTYLLAGHWVNMTLISRNIAKWPINPTVLNEIMKTRKSEKIEGYLSKSIYAQTMTVFMGCNLHVMTHVLYGGDKPLPQGLAVLNTYREMTTGSKSMPVVVRNMTATPITLKKNTAVAGVVAPYAVSNIQVLPGTVEQLDAAQGIQMGRTKMTVEQQKEALFEQLDLNSLDSWTPSSRAVAHSLLAEYHDIFSIDSCELGSVDLAQHIIKVLDDEPF